MASVRLAAANTVTARAASGHDKTSASAATTAPSRFAGAIFIRYILRYITPPGRSSPRPAHGLLEQTRESVDVGGDGECSLRLDLPVSLEHIAAEAGESRAAAALSP